MKKKIAGLLLSAAILAAAIAGCGNNHSSSSGSGTGDSDSGDTQAKSESDAGAADYDVENREYKDVNITIHTRWDVGDVSGPLYQAIVEGFM